MSLSNADRTEIAEIVVSVLRTAGLIETQVLAESPAKPKSVPTSKPKSSPKATPKAKASRKAAPKAGPKVQRFDATLDFVETSLDKVQAGSVVALRANGAQYRVLRTKGVTTLLHASGVEYPVSDASRPVFVAC